MTATEIIFFENLRRKLGRRIREQMRDIQNNYGLDVPFSNLTDKTDREKTDDMLKRRMDYEAV